MTWADDIAYSIHDTEDFYRAGLIPLDRLAGKRSDERSRFLQAVYSRWSAEGKDLKDFKKYAAAFEAFCKTLLLVSEPYSGTRSQRYSLRSLTSYMIGRYVMSTILTDGSKPLRFSESTYQYEMEMLKELTWHYVIGGPSLAGQQEGHRRIISVIFDVFVNACFGQGRDWSVLPPRYKEEMQILYETYGDAIGHELRVRTAADAVAGLTDIEAIRLYQRLTGTHPGSAVDPIAI